MHSQINERDRSLRNVSSLPDNFKKYSNAYSSYFRSASLLLRALSVGCLPVGICMYVCMYEDILGSESTSENMF